MNNLGLLYGAQGNAGNAESLLRQALDVRKQAFGDKHPDTAQSYGNLASFYRDRKDFVRAEPLARAAAQIVTEHLVQSASGQSERSQIAHLDKQRSCLDIFLACTLDGESKDGTGYEVILRWKGAVTTRQRLTRLARKALVDADAPTRQLFERLDSVSHAYARLAQAPAGRVVADLTDRLTELEKQREQIEIDLSRRTEGFRRLRQSQQITLKQLQESLPADAVLIDFLIYRRAEAKQQPVNHLVAFLITSKSTRRVELGPAAPIAKSVDAFRDQMVRHLSRDVRSPGRLLREKIWQPLALAGAKLVLIAPDGPLCRLPFGALPSADGEKYLIEETAIAILPVPQLLPELLVPRPVGNQPSLLAMGGIDFDAEALSQPSKQPTIVASSRRLPVDEARSGRTQLWQKLPGAEAEVSQLESLFKKEVPGGTLTVLTKGSATTKAFRQHAIAHQFIHLATHGFFAERSIRSALPSDPRIADRLPNGESSHRGPLSFDPGLFSGIVLAGANKPREDDNGILTALEVAELDLSKVEMAVLSACETGLGETAGGEGVLGLQRAFQVAGARTTVTSLWKVSDEATRNLMERFYENRWKKGLGPLEALREAQLAMMRGNLPRGNNLPRGAERDDERPGERRSLPYYWAAFVLSGDWR